jgi:predicted RND superfamily exporter protein
MRKLGIGFGLEAIGLAAQRHAVLATLLIAVLTAFSAWNLTRVQFDGNVTAVLPEESQAFRNYFDQKQRFRDFSRDITLIVQSPRLNTAAGLEDLRNLQLEIALEPAVANAVSIFSLPKADPQTGELVSAFPKFLESDGQANAILDELFESRPEAQSLFSREEATAAIVVTMVTGIDVSDAEAFEAYGSLRRAARAAAPQDFRLLYTGLTPIGATIVGALISDQLRLTVIGLALGAGIALIVFRSAIAAIICALPPLLTAVWSLGVFGFFGIPVNYLSTVLPTLALILAYADGIVLFFRWQASNRESEDRDANLTEALQRVGPASSLTSITTLLAFLSFSFAPGSALKEFSMLGMAVVSIAFLAVMLALPVAIHWTIRLGLRTRGKGSKGSFGGIGSFFWGIVSPRPGRIAIVGLLAVAGLSFVHALVTPEYRITDYLPKESQTREAEAVANSLIGGRSFLFIGAPAVEKGEAFAPGNLQRVSEIEAVVTREFPPERVLSVARIARELKDEAALAQLSADLAAAPPSVRASFISQDGETIQLGARVPSDQRIGVTLGQIERLEAALRELPYGEQIVVTGFDVLMAREFTNLIEQLRTSLLIAVALGVVIIGIATRSPLMTLAAITPNLLPVLAVEFVVWLRGGSINLSEVIALTISFGIAIDNAVHVINVHTSELRAGRSSREALANAMREVGPALAASTLIICTASLVTQVSVLPMVPVLGVLMVSTLAVALVSNLAILPANILVLARLAGRREEREKQ